MIKYQFLYLDNEETLITPEVTEVRTTETQL